MNDPSPAEPGRTLIAPDASVCGQPRPATTPGHFAARYEIGEEIARGGMGTVYAARDAVLNRRVAIKVIQEHFAHQPNVVARFLEEARITGQLQHPGIPPVHDLGTLPDGRPFLAMKLIKGRTLADLLTESRNLSALLPVFEQVCQAVAYAHDRGLIHRDLKPLNVMVGAFGEVQVMDWGIAKVLGAPATPEPEHPPATGIDPGRDRDETGIGSVVGTLAYMPPEQARGELDRVGRHSDVFALGGILCEVLTGKPVYTGPRVVLRAHAELGLTDEAFARLDACGADPELVDLARRCLAKDPAGRPADANAVTGVVAAYRAGVEARLRKAEADRAAAAAEAREQRKRRRVQQALAAAVVVIAAGGAAFAWWQDRQATERRLKGEQTRVGVRANLDQAATLRKQYRFAEARKILATARGLAESDAPDLLPDVERAVADLDFVIDLDVIRMKRSTWVQELGGKGHFDEEGAPPEYRKAFAKRGLDVVEGDATAAAARVAASAVKPELVAALDEWAVLEPDVPIRNRVLEVVRRADPGPWLDQFRTPTVHDNPLALWWMVRRADPTKLAPSTIIALSYLMRHHGFVSRERLLTAALNTYPNDFTVAFHLGLMSEDPRDKIMYYRIARATRADNLALLINLGVSLARVKDADGAIACYLEAIDRDRTFAKAYYNMGVVLSSKGDAEGAIWYYRETIKHDRGYSAAHNDLGVALFRKGDFVNATACYREAFRLNPKSIPARSNLIALLKRASDTAGVVAVYEAAAQVDTAAWHELNKLAMELYGKKDLDNAVAAFRASLRVDSRHVMVHGALGYTLAEKGDADGAIAAFREAAKLDPTNPAYPSELARLLRTKGDLVGAMAASAQSARLKAERDARVAPPPREVKR